jgi:hypothetical protein
MPEQPIDPASAGCKNWDDHDFAKEYYGYRCKKCDLFFAFGCEPWSEMEDEDDDD